MDDQENPKDQKPPAEVLDEQTNAVERPPPAREIFENYDPLQGKKEQK